MKPVHALINIVGAKPSVRTELKNIIQEGLVSVIHKPQTSSNFHYAKPLYNIQSFDMPVECPRPFKKRQPMNDHMHQPPSSAQEIGYIKQNFFKAFGKTKPAVTIFVFDWSKEDPTNFEWKSHEQLIIEYVKDHSESWQRDLSVPSKYVLIICLPIQDQQNMQNPLGQPYINVEECRNSFKRAVQVSNDEYIKSSNYFLSNGLDSLHSTLNKKFVKNVHELVVAYYREKKENIKKKQKRLIGGQIQHVKYALKCALYSLLTSNDMRKALTKLDFGYQQLNQAMMSSTSRLSLEEKRDNADIFALFMIRLQLMCNNLQKAVDVYRAHFFQYSISLLKIKPERQFEEIKWKATWFQLMGKLLEEFYKVRGGLFVHQQDWHSAHSLNQFPGYYYMNCMLQLIARKQQIRKLKISYAEQGKQLYDPDDLQKYSVRLSPYIGKEIILYDSSDNQKVQLNNTSFQELVCRYKVFAEDQINIDGHILTAAHKAIGYYKQRSQVLKGPSAVMHQRTVHMINYHISELLKGKQSSELEQNSVDQEFVTTTERQKYRKHISDHLIKENWIAEAVSLIEKSKASSDNLEEYFQNELKVLIHDKYLANHKRHQRLVKLVEKVQNERTGSSKPVKLIGHLIGSGLIWARARFEHSKVQVNQFNKLTIELFSKLSQPLRIQNLEIKLSQPNLNQTVNFAEGKDGAVDNEGAFIFSKNSPLVVERSFYLEQEDDQIGCIMLNQILITIAAPEGTADAEIRSDAFNQLQFSVSPYLKPLCVKEEGKQIKRLPPPIMYAIEPMPHKLKFNFDTGISKDQALLGHPYEIKVDVYKNDENVVLKSIQVQLTKIDSQPVQSTDDDLLASKSDFGSIEGMQSINLSDSRQSNRMSASLFSTDKSQGLMSSRSLRHSYNAVNDSNFLGVDSSLGVSVIKHPPVEGEGDQYYDDLNQLEVHFKDVNQEKQLKIEYPNNDYPETEHVNLSLDDPSFLLKLFYYQEERLNRMQLKIDYTFTQNKGVEQEQIHHKTYIHHLNVFQQPPFKVDWQVQTSNSFLASLKYFFSQRVGANQILEKQSIFSDMSLLSDQMKALCGDMITNSNDTTWLVLKVSSLSKHRKVMLKELDLEINPDMTDFIEKIHKEQDTDEVVLEPGESFECLFKLKIREAPNEYLLADNQSRSQIIPNKPSQMGPAGQALAQSMQQTQNESIEQWLKHFKVSELEHFSEVHFKWSTFKNEDTEETVESIQCCSGGPALYVVEVPIQVRIINEREISNVKVFEPFTVELEILNVSEQLINTFGQLDISQSLSSGQFMIAGEIKSSLNLMPSGEPYILRYTIFPQKLGLLTLPKFSLVEKTNSKVVYIKDFTKKVYVTSN